MSLTIKELRSLTSALRNKRLSQTDLGRVKIALRLWNMSRVYSLEAPKLERLEQSIRITLASALTHSLARDQLAGPLVQLRKQITQLRRIENRCEEASHGRTLRTVLSSRVRPHANPSNQPDAKPSDVGESAPERQNQRGWNVHFEQQEKFEQLVETFGQGVDYDAFAAKLSPEHITTLLRHAESQDKRRHERYKSSRIQRAGLAVAGMGCVVFLCWLFLAYSHSELLTPNITLIIGAAGGYGAGRQSVRKKK